MIIHKSTTMKKILFLLCLFAFLYTDSQAQRWKKTKAKFTKKVAVLTRHPDEIYLKGNNDTTSYYYYVTDAGLFFTEKKDLVDEIAKYLPSIEIPGRYVELEGTTLKPFTKIPKRQLDYLSRKAGKAINKQTEAIRISGHSLKSSVKKEGPKVANGENTDSLKLIIEQLEIKEKAARAKADSLSKVKTPPPPAKAATKEKEW